MDAHAQRMKEVDNQFDEIFFGCLRDEEPAPVSLMRAATKMIVASYPGGTDRDLAVANLISSAKHLRAAEPS